MRWITSQIGAREHYAVPRVLHQEGKLERLYTDFWASATWRLLGKVTGKVSLASRCHVDLIGAPVTGFNFHSLKASRQRFANPYDGFFQIGRQFGELVVKDLEKQSRVERRVSRAMMAESRDEGRGTRDGRPQLPATSYQLHCIFWLRYGFSGTGPMGEGTWREDDRLPDGSGPL